jgi:hypothetical protein
MELTSWGAVAIHINVLSTTVGINQWAPTYGVVRYHFTTLCMVSGKFGKKVALTKHLEAYLITVIIIILKIYYGHNFCE